MEVDAESDSEAKQCEQAKVEEAEQVAA